MHAMVSDALLAVADSALRQVLAIALEADGWRVQTASDGATAGRKLESRKPDLLMLDGKMPVEDGVAAWVERHALGVPLVVLVSGWQPPPVLPRDNATLLPLPFGRDELRRAIAAVCRCVASKTSSISPA
jgi:DNA-binding response OmpR family regulator